MAKKKKVDRKKRKGRMNTDPVTVQVSIRAQVPKGFKLSQEFMEQITHEWAKTGETPPGIEIEVMRWRNPARAGKKGNWRNANTEDEKQCKLIRRMLRGTSAKLAFAAVG